VALLIIATMYTDSVATGALLAAGGLLAVLLAVRAIGIQLGIVYAGLGAALWVALFKAGVDPVVTGLVLGLLTLAYLPARTDLERASELFRLFREQPTPELARSARLGVDSAISPNERLQQLFHPWTSYAIVPVFALANAGIHIDRRLLSDAISSPITLGIMFGYVVGKPVGIVAATWLASRPWLLGMRRALSWPVIVGGGTVGGIGFTVSLLISSLAFQGRQLEEAKLGVLAAAVIASLLAWTVFGVIRRMPETKRARQILGTRDDILDLAVDIDPERDHIRGPEDAPVTLVEYGDYECPYCGQAEVVIRELLDSFGDDLRYVWRNLPLNDVHEHAQMAAEAAEAAAAQGKFWEMHDKLLDHQGELQPDDLGRYAEEIGLDMDRFWDDLHNRRHAARVAEDVASADASGVVGTPTFFINGKRHQGAYDVQTLTDAVRRARTRARLGETAGETSDAQPVG
jgi:protein-disulfide isomerase